MSKINYSVMDKGIGLYLMADVSYERISKQSLNRDVLSTDFEIAFSDSVPNVFHEGRRFIYDVIDKYIDNINQNGIEPHIIKILNVETNPAHYQPEIFLGIGIKILQKIGVFVDDPHYYFDDLKREFIFSY